MFNFYTKISKREYLLFQPGSLFSDFVGKDQSFKVFEITVLRRKLGPKIDEVNEYG
jgi:hypothetical protein